MIIHKKNCACGISSTKIKDSLPEDILILEVADFFKVMSDRSRLKILQALSFGELCVCDIALALSMSQSAISHQLRILRQSNLVKKRKDGKTAYYSLADKHVEIISRYAFQHIMEKLNLGVE